MSIPDTESAAALLLHAHYTPEELARLLDVNLQVILNAVWSGNLKAFVLDHHVIDISRADVIAWLNTR